VRAYAAVTELSESLAIRVFWLKISMIKGLIASYPLGIPLARPVIRTVQALEDHPLRIVDSSR
jgi:hypothetical protein